MRIDVVELRVVALPMRAPFRTAHGTVDERTVVLVRVAGPDVEGWGECAALPEPTYSAEHVDGALLVLRDHLVPRLLARSAAHGLGADDVAPSLADVAGHPMAKASLELALLDAEGRRDGQSLADRLCPDGSPRSTVRAGAAVGLQASPEALAAAVEALVAAGYGRLKLKIAPGRDRAHLRAARAAAGEGTELVVDANGAYRLDASPGDPDDARSLGWLDDLGVGHLEQPLPADALLGHAELARELATPICLDESLVSETATAEALATGACRVVCVKAPRYGSWLTASRILERCRLEGVPAWVGGMLDAGPGRTANLALAAHPGATVTGDASSAAHTFGDDVVAARSPVADVVPLAFAVPREPGLGATLDPAALGRLTRHVETIRAPG